MRLLAVFAALWSCFALFTTPLAVASPLKALAFTSLTVTPHTGLVDGQSVSVRVTGGSYGTTYAVVDCDPKALALLLQPGASVEDACDSRHNSVMTVAANRVATTSLALPAVLTTALGGANCLKVSCFVAVEAIHSTGGASTLVQYLTFSANACAAPRSCATPADAWDPKLGPPPVRSSPTPPTSGAPPVSPPATPTSTGLVGQPGSPLTVSLTPMAAGSLTAPGSVTGPFNGQLSPGVAATTTTIPTTTVPATTVPTTTVPDHHRLHLHGPTRHHHDFAPCRDRGGPSAPGPRRAGHLVGPGPPSSTVVDATLTDLATHQTSPKQQFVLFWGASPFVYAAFVGPDTQHGRRTH